MAQPIVPEQSDLVMSVFQSSLFQMLWCDDHLKQDLL